MRSGHDILAKASFVAAALFASVLASPALSFHSGGVGECTGCHDLHGSSNPDLLSSDDASSTCLTCHQQAGENGPNGHHVATDDADMPPGSPPGQMTPGGDFGWLKKNYRWNSAEGGAGGESPGERHGHSIVAAAYGYAADTASAAAPGGSYPSSGLSCTSCHDPHGRYRRLAGGSIGTSGAPVMSSGSYDTSPDPTSTAAVGVYRLLGGKGYARPGISESFNADPPAAVAPADYNRSESGADTRVAYGSGMSEWCVNCHGAYSGPGSGKGHPAGNHVKMTSRTIANYNAYIGSGNLAGTSSSSYTSIAPFEMGTSDYAILKRTASRDGSVKAGPDTASNVTCLTCHRAHATAWDQATRWNMKTEFLVYNGDYPGTDMSELPSRISQGRTKAETRRAFYERPASTYATYQRSLCNKCHTMD